ARRVAVRSLDAQSALLPAVRSRFIAEARLVAQLEHPGILRVHDMGLLPDGRPYYTTPSVSGKTLEEAAPVHELPALFRAIRRVAETLDYAHENGVLHLAVSPKTVFLADSGSVYLLDWSSARVRAKLEPESGEDSGLHPLPERPGGTPYTSPEQASGKPLDRRADVYSLGATLAFGLAGKPPSRAAGVGRLAGVRRGLAAIVAKAMARKRKGRYATAGELAADLARFEASEPITARRDSLLARAARFFRRRPRLVAALVVLVAASLLGAGWFGNAAYQEGVRRAARAAQEERNRARRFRENIEEAKKLAPEEAALRKALAHAQRAAKIAATPGEETLASESLVRAYLGLARFALEHAKAPVGPVALALEHVRAAEEASGGAILAADIAAVRRDAEGRVSFRATGEGNGEVRIYRLDRNSIEAGELAAQGAFGEVFDLTTGGYLVLAQAQGTLEVRLPVWLERGFEENRDVTIPLPSEAPAGFVFVPPGWAKLGEEGKRTWIDHGFFIAKAELTWREYEEFLVAQGTARSKYEPHYWTAGNVQEVVPASARKSDHPVFGVSHDDLVAYCLWRSARNPAWEFSLPSSEEWEWAARGADGRTYPWGDSFDRARVNLQGDRTEFSLDTLTERAGSHPEGRSVFDSLQMADNLKEWTDTNRGGTSFELRGGCWGSPDPEARCWFSVASASDNRIANIGGRVVAVAGTH
ncbi:MAG: SUMF1/EgtB/PvdO family nonheme iron enzyme, partial [Planctomycetes bacterium]|nr:SUMF1/EgtB/PvdO family nonheme iron enzyme [Planctomycetota bacterium]